MSEANGLRGERTREEIVNAAHQLFLERGYHGTSMREIAQQAHVALGGIYNHFISKDDIFTAVLIEHHPYLEMIPAMQAAQGDTLEEFVRDAARRMVSGLGERPDFLNLMFIELVEFNGRHIPQLFEIIFPQLMGFARRFVEDGEQLRPIPVPTLMRAFVGLFFSYVITEIMMGKQMPADMQENSFDYFVDIFLHGIIQPAN